jgi:hypothetical protein
LDPGSEIRDPEKVKIRNTGYFPRILKIHALVTAGVLKFLNFTVRNISLAADANETEGEIRYRGF